jgi:hypothetical protein
MSNLFPSDLKNQKLLMDALQCSVLGMKTDGFGDPSADARAKATGQARARFKKYYSDQHKEAKQARFVGTSSDLPDTSTNSFDVIRAGQEYDLDWMQAIKDRPVDEGKDFFEIVTIENSLKTRLVPEGGKLRLEELTGTIVNVKLNKYGQGLQITDEMIRFRKVGMMIDLAEEQREAHWATKADRMYGLYAASSGATGSYITETGNEQFENDIATISADYTGLIRANQAKFSGLRANAEVLLYLPIEGQTRINRALRKLVDATTGSASIIPWNVRPIYTLNGSLPSAQTGEAFRGLMILPGRKIQMAQLLAPTIYNDFDILSLSQIQAEWEYFGAGVAETSQIRTVVFE